MESMEHKMQDHSKQFSAKTINSSATTSLPPSTARSEDVKRPRSPLLPPPNPKKVFPVITIRNGERTQNPLTAPLTMISNQNDGVLLQVKALPGSVTPSSSNNSPYKSNDEESEEILVMEEYIENGILGIEICEQDEQSDCSFSICKSLKYS